jgi:toxin-antitoxin system PIN domain toxin
VIGVDTNLLVYAHRRDSEWHRAAAALIMEVAENEAPWGIPAPCIHEFLAIVTHPRIYAPPTPIAVAVQQVDMWLESPSARLLGELQGHWDEVKAIIRAGKVIGGAVHDARIAAICREHGVSELWSVDRDFGRISGVRVRNPLLHANG